LEAGKFLDWSDLVCAAEEKLETKKNAVGFLMESTTPVQFPYLREGVLLKATALVLSFWNGQEFDQESRRYFYRRQKGEVNTPCGDC
jgi:hypothetical protein